MNWMIPVRRLGTKPFRKTFKILEHFEERHKYILSPEATKLRRTVEDSLRSSTSVTKLDQLLCARLRDLNTEGLLSVLNSWGSVKPDILSSTIFYQAFVKIVRKGLWKSAPWNHLVQIMYFVGYLNGQDDSKQLMILFLHAVNDSPIIAHADFKDVCIISEAAFRTSTGISSPAIRTRITDILKAESGPLIEDPVWLVMLIKMMMFSKFHDVGFVENLGHLWMQQPEQLQRMPFTAKCYVLSLFAHAGVKHEGLGRVLIESVARNMTRRDFRIKDVSTFLWAVHFLNFKLDRGFLETVVMPFLESQMNERNLGEGLNIVVKCCVAYWMLDRAPRIILDRMITEDSLNTLMEKNKNFRDLSRLMLLIDILECEPPGHLTSQQKSVKAALNRMKILVPSMQRELEKRPALRELVTCLTSRGFQNVRLEHPVRIYIAGVTVEINRNIIHIDLLDSTVCIASTATPAGLILAKVRLLKLKQPYIRHIYISPDHINKNLPKENWLELFGLARTSNIERTIRRP